MKEDEIISQFCALIGFDREELKTFVQDVHDEYLYLAISKGSDSADMIVERANTLMAIKQILDQK